MFKRHRNFCIFLFMLILLPLAGEPKFHPFSGDFQNFRVSFGSPVFLLFLLWLRRVPFLVSGISTGIAVVVFRGLLDVWTGGVSLSAGIWAHAPTFFYYFTYAGFFILPNFDKNHIYHRAIQLAAWSVVSEIIASIAELSFTQLLFYEIFTLPSPEILVRLTAIAFLRCFFILSFFFLTQLNATESRLQQEESELSHMMLLISNLYEELIQLNKSQKNAESVTHDCYKMYEQLNEQTNNEEQKQLAQKILAIAGQLHEIKKDNQRIYAGLAALTNNHHIADYARAKTLAHLILDSQRKYARSLKKNIFFLSKVDNTLPPLHVYTLLSLINNLIANAVEAIKTTGSIRLSLQRQAADLLVQVENTGSAIAPQKLSLIFQPGYTTKFDQNGNASTGIGLSYVKDLAQTLGGSVSIDSDGQHQVCCRLKIPLTACSASPTPAFSLAWPAPSSKKTIPGPTCSSGQTI